MNVLMLGNGSGSFQMRGVQLGTALDARVRTQPTTADLQWADVVVLVKRAGMQYAALVHKHGKRLIWDALDFWTQPGQNTFTQGEAVQLLRRQVAIIKPTLVIAATQAMADVCGGVYVPHHTWSGLVPTPPRRAVQVIAYEGSERYLGGWRPVLEAICQRHSWRFVINPASLSQADLIVAFRDGAWDGWICRAWKSGVKVGNAIAAGRPLITQDSAAVRELNPIGTIVERWEDLEQALVSWADDDVQRREYAYAVSVASAKGLTLESVAERYRGILASVAIGAAA